MRTLTAVLHSEIRQTELFHIILECKALGFRIWLDGVVLGPRECFPGCSTEMNWLDYSRLDKNEELTEYYGLQ